MANDLDPPAVTGIAADATAFSLGTPGLGRGWQSPAARYYPNIESYPGEIFVKPPLVSAKREQRMGRAAAVKMARALERTNEHIRGGTDKRVNMVVGATLRVMPQVNWRLLMDAAPGMFPDEETARKWAQDYGAQCYRQFNDWGFGNRLLCDGEGHYNFGGLMWLAFRNLAGPDAETVGVIQYDQARADAYKHRWATFVTVVDPDRVQTPPEMMGDDSDVADGRELDINGRMTALYISVGHPGDGGLDAVKFVRAPRENGMGRPMAWQFFSKTRATQQRGLTAWVTVLRGAGMFDTFDDAQLGNATKAASLATYIETMASAETVAEQMAPAGGGVSAWEQKLDYYGRAKVRFGGQKLQVFPPGDKVVMEGMAQSIADPSGFRNGFLRAFASALGISFEQISNNFSEANYSSARAALLEMWRGVMADRTLFTSHVASLIYSAVIEEAIGKGRITLPPGAPNFYEYRDAYVGCSWTGPGMGWIDPQKEANAQAIRLANKMTTRQKEWAMAGDDWQEGFEQIHEEDVMAASFDPPIDLSPPATTGMAGNPALPPADEPEEPAPSKKPTPAPAGA